MGDANRVEAIHNDFSKTLEERITGLMATVQAAREINRQLIEADGEIGLMEAEVTSIEEQLASLDDSSDEYESGLDQVDALRHAIRETQDVVGDLTGALESLVGEL